MYTVTNIHPVCSIDLCIKGDDGYETKRLYSGESIVVSESQLNANIGAADQNGFVSVAAN